MVTQRQSIVQVGNALADHVLNGGETTEGIRLASKLKELCEGRGRYVKKYEDPEERILMRHLSLYKNKLAYAKSDAEKTRWREKLRDQRAKIADYHAQKAGGRTGLDLDGL